MQILTRALAAVILLTVLAALPRTAHADASLSLVGVLNLSNLSGTLSLPGGTPPFPNANSVSTDTTVGFGGLLDVGMVPGFGLELGALYVPRKINVNNSSGTSLGGVTLKELELSALIRLNLLPILSLGLGPYYARALGNITLSANGLPDENLDYSGTGINSNDVGLEASLAAHLPLLPGSLGAVVDARYLFGLSNLDTTGVTSQHFRDFQLLFGVTLGG